MSSENWKKLHILKVFKFSWGLEEPQYLQRREQIMAQSAQEISRAVWWKFPNRDVGVAKRSFVQYHAYEHSRISVRIRGTVLTGGDQFQDSEGRGSRQKVDSWSCISRKQNLVFGLPRPPFKNPKKRSLEMCSWNAVTVLQMPKPTWTASRKHCKRKKDGLLQIY